MLEPKRGLLTFRAEGDDFKGGRNYSRKIHWPGLFSGCTKNNSGVTIGRGFDLGDRSKQEVVTELRRAGISNEQARKISEAAGLKGCLAGEYVKYNKEDIGDISDYQQLKLFEITYNAIEKDVKRICQKSTTIKAYHPNPKTSPGQAWQDIPEKIKEVLIDLRYRGDYTPYVRNLLQRYAYAGDVVGFGRVLSNRDVWPKVPQERFNRRVRAYEN